MYVCMYVLSHVKFHMVGSSSSLVIAINSKSKQANKYRAVAMLLFYFLQKQFTLVRVSFLSKLYYHATRQYLILV
jgi:hypothetical protein